jgi:alpha-tubulin suppressor-like RCC1 family protein
MISIYISELPARNINTISQIYQREMSEREGVSLRENISSEIANKELCRIIALYEPKVLLRLGIWDDRVWEQNTKIVFGRDIEKRTIKCVDGQMWKKLYRYLSDDVLIRCGGQHTLILVNEKLYGWGDSQCGQLGVDETGKYVSTVIPINYDNVGDIAEISCGGYHTIIQNVKGYQYGCGYNYHTQLGSYTSMSSVKKFMKLKSTFGHIVEITCGKFYTILRDVNGKIYKYGSSILDPQNVGYRYIKIQNIAGNIVDMKSGNNFTIFRNDRGKIYLYGLWLSRNLESMYELGTKENTPNNIVDVACGGFHFIVKDINGKIYAYGINDNGQLGLGDRENRTKFEEIKIKLDSDIAEISCGQENTLLRTIGGSIYSCGRDISLLHDSKICVDGSAKFVHLHNLPENIVELKCGNYDIAFRTLDGKVYQAGRLGSDRKYKMIDFN